MIAVLAEAIEFIPQDYNLLCIYLRIIISYMLWSHLTMSIFRSVLFILSQDPGTMLGIQEMPICSNTQSFIHSRNKYLLTHHLICARQSSGFLNAREPFVERMTENWDTLEKNHPPFQCGVVGFRISTLFPNVKYSLAGFPSLCTSAFLLKHTWSQQKAVATKLAEM